MRRGHLVPRRPTQGTAGQYEVCVTCSQGLILGRIEGKLDGVLEAQKLHGEKMDTLDTRLRSVENRSAVVGAAAAVLMTLGIDFARWKLKG